MSKKILVIDSSARVEGSYSRLLVEEFLALLQTRGGPHSIVRHDLALHPIPTLDPDVVVAIRTKPDQLTESQHQVAALSTQLIAELKAADIILIGAPMYNWGIPAALKAWVDQVVRSGFTFTYGANGPEGLLPGKSTAVMLSRGGIYSTPDRAVSDFQKPYLDKILRIMGLEPEFVLVEGTLMGSQTLDSSLAAARQGLQALAQRFT